MAKQKEFTIGLTYDDVLLVPQYSAIASRKLIDLRTKFSRNINLSMPIVSANMDTVTESEMAITLAGAGGIGIIHRFMTGERQAAEVRRVKRAESLVITDPVIITKDATLHEALAMMANAHTTGILVCDKKGMLEGIITARDVRFKTDLTVPVQRVMTPRSRLITAPKSISQEAAMTLLDAHKLEKLPLIDRAGKLVGLITAKDFLRLAGRQHVSKDRQGRLLVGAALGVRDGVTRAEQLVAAGVDALVIDIAHGHHIQAITLLKQLKKKYRRVDVVAGNVATVAGVRDLIRGGADAIKVGIGPGAACSTRIVAGAGVPQLTAVLACAAAARRADIPIIADGGIKNSGDLAKAMAAGASTAMIGNLFAGTKESPGEYFLEDGAPFKIYRGLASREASPDRGRAPEGVSMKVAYKGEVKNVLTMLLDGLQSGMSYSGSKTIKELWRKAQFIRITEAGMKESMPRP